MRSTSVRGRGRGGRFIRKRGNISHFSYPGGSELPSDSRRRRGGRPRSRIARGGAVYTYKNRGRGNNVSSTTFNNKYGKTKVSHEETDPTSHTEEFEANSCGVDVMSDIENDANNFDDSHGAGIAEDLEMQLQEDENEDTSQFSEVVLCVPDTSGLDSSLVKEQLVKKIGLNMDLTSYNHSIQTKGDQMFFVIQHEDNVELQEAKKQIVPIMQSVVAEMREAMNGPTSDKAESDNTNVTKLQVSNEDFLSIMSSGGPKSDDEPVYGFLVNIPRGVVCEEVHSGLMSKYRHVTTYAGPDFPLLPMFKFTDRSLPTKFCAVKFPSRKILQDFTKLCSPIRWKAFTACIKPFPPESSQIKEMALNIRAMMQEKNSSTNNILPDNASLGLLKRSRGVFPSCVQPEKIVVVIDDVIPLLNIDEIKKRGFDVLTGSNLDVHGMLDLITGSEHYKKDGVLYVVQPGLDFILKNMKVLDLEVVEAEKSNNLVPNPKIFANYLSILIYNHFEKSSQYQKRHLSNAAFNITSEVLAVLDKCNISKLATSREFLDSTSETHTSIGKTEGQALMHENLLVSKSVPFNDEASKSVPSNDEASKSVPSNDEASKSVPSNNEASKSVPSNDEASKSVPSNDEVSKSVPSNDEVSKSVPSNDEVSKSVPSNDEVSKSVPSNDEVSKSVPSNDEVSKSVPSNDEVSKSVTSNNEASKSVASNNEASKSVPSNDEASKSVPVKDDLSSSWNLNYTSPTVCIEEDQDPMPSYLQDFTSRVLHLALALRNSVLVNTLNSEVVFLGYPVEWQLADGAHTTFPKMPETCLKHLAGSFIAALSLFNIFAEKTWKFGGFPSPSFNDDTVVSIDECVHGIKKTEDGNHLGGLAAVKRSEDMKNKISKEKKDETIMKADKIEEISCEKSMADGLMICSEDALMYEELAEDENCDVSCSKLNSEKCSPKSSDLDDLVSTCTTRQTEIIDLHVDDEEKLRSMLELEEDTIERKFTPSIMMSNNSDGDCLDLSLLKQVCVIKQNITPAVIRILDFVSEHFEMHGSFPLWTTIRGAPCSPASHISLLKAYVQKTFYSQRKDANNHIFYKCTTVCHSTRRMNFQETEAHAYKSQHWARLTALCKTGPKHLQKSANYLYLKTLKNGTPVAPDQIKRLVKLGYVEELQIGVDQRYKCLLCLDMVELLCGVALRMHLQCKNHLHHLSKAFGIQQYFTVDIINNWKTIKRAFHHCTMDIVIVADSIHRPTLTVFTDINPRVHVLTVDNLLHNSSASLEVLSQWRDIVAAQKAAKINQAPALFLIVTGKELIFKPPSHPLSEGKSSTDNDEHLKKKSVPDQEDLVNEDAVLNHSKSVEEGKSFNEDQVFQWDNLLKNMDQTISETVLAVTKLHSFFHVTLPHNCRVLVTPSLPLTVLSDATPQPIKARVAQYKHTIVVPSHMVQTVSEAYSIISSEVYSIHKANSVHENVPYVCKTRAVEHLNVTEKRNCLLSSLWHVTVEKVILNALQGMPACFPIFSAKDQANSNDLGLYSLQSQSMIVGNAAGWIQQKQKQSSIQRNSENITFICNKSFTFHINDMDFILKRAKMLAKQDERSFVWYLSCSFPDIIYHTKNCYMCINAGCETSVKIWSTMNNDEDKEFTDNACHLTLTKVSRFLTCLQSKLPDKHRVALLPVFPTNIVCFDSVNKTVHARMHAMQDSVPCINFSPKPKAILESFLRQFAKGWRKISSKILLRHTESSNPFNLPSIHVEDINVEPCSLKYHSMQAAEKWLLAVNSLLKNRYTAVQVKFTPRMVALLNGEGKPTERTDCRELLSQVKIRKQQRNAACQKHQHPSGRDEQQWWNKHEDYNDRASIQSNDPSTCRRMDDGPFTHGQMDDGPFTHRQINDGPSTHMQMDDRGPTHRRMDEGGPIHRRLDEGGPIHRRLDEGGPIHRRLDEGGPIHRRLDEGGPIHRRLDEGGPIHRRLDGNQSPYRQIDGSQFKRMRMDDGSSHSRNSMEPMLPSVERNRFNIGSQHSNTSSFQTRPSRAHTSSDRSEEPLPWESSFPKTVARVGEASSADVTSPQFMFTVATASLEPLSEHWINMLAWAFKIAAKPTSGPKGCWRVHAPSARALLGAQRFLPAVRLVDQQLIVTVEASQTAVMPVTSLEEEELYRQQLEFVVHCYNDVHVPKVINDLKNDTSTTFFRPGWQDLYTADLSRTIPIVANAMRSLSLIPRSRAGSIRLLVITPSTDAVLVMTSVLQTVARCLGLTLAQILHGNENIDAGATVVVGASVPLALSCSRLTLHDLSALVLDDATVFLDNPTPKEALLTLLSRVRRTSQSYTSINKVAVARNNSLTERARVETLLECVFGGGSGPSQLPQPHLVEQNVNQWDESWPKQLKDSQHKFQERSQKEQISTRPNVSSSGRELNRDDVQFKPRHKQFKQAEFREDQSRQYQERFNAGQDQFKPYQGLANSQLEGIAQHKQLMAQRNPFTPQPTLVRTPNLYGQQQQHSLSGHAQESSFGHAQTQRTSRDPVPDRHWPGPDRHWPGPDRHQLGPDRHQPGPDRHQPGPDRHQPGPDRHQPGPDRHRPGPDRHRPGPDRHQPGPDRHQPTASRHGENSNDCDSNGLLQLISNFLETRKRGPRNANLNDPSSAISLEYMSTLTKAQLETIPKQLLRELYDTLLPVATNLRK